jgi:quercetin dioxygenase-like cupin family protein
METAAIDKTAPIIVDWPANAFKTDMFTSSSWLMGEKPEQLTSAEHPGPPMIGVATCEPGTSTNTHYHAGWSVLMIVEGSYDVLSGQLAEGTVILGEPGHLTGECAPGPNGVRELLFFNSIYSAVPFFIDEDDTRSKTMLDQLPPDHAHFRTLTPPGPDYTSGVTRLDREKHKLEGSQLTLFPLQIGPKGFGALPDPQDGQCYAALFEFKPGARLPLHSREGWSAVSVIDGDVKVCGVTRKSDVGIVFEPGTPASFDIGPAGARAFFFFENGKAAIPQFDNPDDPAAAELLAMLKA